MIPKSFSTTFPLWSRLTTPTHTSQYMMLLHDSEPDDLLLLQILSYNKLSTKSQDGAEILLPLSFIQTGGFIADQSNEVFHKFVFPPLIKDGLISQEETELAKIPGPSALNPLNSKFSAMFDSFKGKETMDSVRNLFNEEYERKLLKRCKINGRNEATEEEKFWVAGEMMPSVEAIIKSRDDIIRHIEQKGNSPLLIVARPFIEIVYEFGLQPSEQRLCQALSKYNAAIVQYSGFNFRENITYMIHKDKEMLKIREDGKLSESEKAQRMEARKEAFCQFYHSSTKIIIVLELYPLYNGKRFSQPQQSQNYMRTHKGDNLDVLKSYISDFNGGMLMRLNNYIPKFLRSKLRSKESKLYLTKFEKLQEKTKELQQLEGPDEREIDFFRKMLEELEEFAIMVLEDEKQAKLKELPEELADERKLAEKHFETRKSRVRKQFIMYQGLSLSRLTAIGLADPAMMLVLQGNPAITSRLFPVTPSGFLHDHLTYKLTEEEHAKIFGSFVTEVILNEEEKKARDADTLSNNSAIDSEIDKLILKTISCFPSSKPLESC